MSSTCKMSVPHRTVLYPPSTAYFRTVPYHTILTERVWELVKDFFNDLAKTFLYKLFPENDKKLSRCIKNNLWMTV